MYYEGPRKQESYLTFISYHFSTTSDFSQIDAPAELAPPIKLVKTLTQEDCTMAIHSNKLTVILVQKEGDAMNQQATDIINRQAEHYLIDSNIYFYTHTFTTESPIDEIRSFPIPKLPTFVLIYRGKIIPYKYTYDEYQEKRVLSEEGFVDLLNDYANLNLNVMGTSYPKQGCIPEVDKILNQATALDRDTLETVEKAVEEAGQEYKPFKPIYKEIIQFVKNDGMEAVWTKLDEQRALIEKTEMEENGEDLEEESESEAEAELQEEMDDVEENSLENLIVYRNILRSFARDIPVGPFEEEELYCCLLLHNLFVFLEEICFLFSSLLFLV